jgi:hypothetical protein
VIGYSAGGVVAWLWDVEYGGVTKARDIITLGSPLHGTSLASLGEAFVPGECPQACEQLVPGSALLTRLAATSPSSRPPWLSLWTTGDQVVQPPDSASLPGAINVPLQSICPGQNIQHGQLPSTPLVTGIVLRALANTHLSAPAPAECGSLLTLGRSLAPLAALPQNANTGTSGVISHLNCANIGELLNSEKIRLPRTYALEQEETGRVDGRTRRRS